MRAAAHEYAGKYGWSVFPCGLNKSPLSISGFLDATRDHDQIDAWWKRWPNASIGVSCIGSALAVVDVDPRHTGEDADDTVRRLCLPETVTSRTGGGGLHVIYRFEDADARLPGELEFGVELKHRGYIIAPPSGHPSGRRYAWDVDHHPDDVEPVPLPDWIAVRPAIAAPAASAPTLDAEWGPRPRYSKAALEGACYAIRRVPIGQQEATLNGEAFSIGQLVASGHMPRELANRLLEWAGAGMANAPGRRPWLQSEIREKVARAFLDAERHPRAPEGRAP